MMQQGQLQELKVSQFQNLQSVTSKATALNEVLRLIRYDSSVESKTVSYRKMMAVLGKAKADEELKQKQLPAVSVAVLFDGNGRKAAHILGFTGLALVDIDGLTPDPIPADAPTRSPSPKGEGSINTCDEAFNKAKADPHTLMVYRTVSGVGLRVLYRYEREDTNPTPGKTNHWSVTINNIKDLLRLPKNSSKFSTEGFKPANLASSGKLMKVPAKAFNPAPALSQIKLSLSRDEGTRTLTVKVNPSSDIAHYIVYAFPDDDNILVNNDVPESQFIIPDTYDGTLTVYAVGRTLNGELVADIAETDYVSATSLLSIQYEDEDSITMSVGQTLSFNVLANWDNGQQQYISPTFTASNANVLSIKEEMVTAKSVGQCVLKATYKGKTCSRTIIVIPSDIITGDVNGDKEVNINDINALLDYILSDDDRIIPESADVNGDGEVNLADINAINAIIFEGTTPPRLPGDVNGDGEVDINDLSMLIDYLLGHEVTPFNAMNADVDSNGTIDISDLVLLIEKLLGNKNINLKIQDKNGDGILSIDDMTDLINYLLSGSW